MKNQIQQTEIRKDDLSPHGPVLIGPPALQHRINLGWLRLWRTAFPHRPPPVREPNSNPARRHLSIVVLLTCLVSAVASSVVAAGEATNATSTAVTNVPPPRTGLARLLPALGFLAKSSAAQSTNLFRAGELSLDLFSTYTVPEPNGLAGLFKTDLGHGKVGAGLGATYWLVRDFGAGLDATVPAVDDLNGGLFRQITFYGAARLPLGKFAPCALAGVGRDFDCSRWNAQVGLGAEWRFNSRTALFADARFVFASHTADSFRIRAGVRFAF